VKGKDESVLASGGRPHRLNVGLSVSTRRAAAGVVGWQGPGFWMEERSPAGEPCPSGCSDGCRGERDRSGPLPGALDHFSRIGVWGRGG
jgi:hypothetical protein